MPDLLKWLDRVSEKAAISDDADGYKTVATALAYLADEYGLVEVAAVEDHFGMPRGSMRELFGNTEYLVLRLPE
jgi:hypothetical protein